jgi:hypothetical protein
MDALWEFHCKAAGPIRNGNMLLLSKPDLVVAFPGGSGTVGMCKKAYAQSIPVIEVKP